MGADQHVIFGQPEVDVEDLGSWCCLSIGSDRVGLRARPVATLVRDHLTRPKPGDEGMIAASWPSRGDARSQHERHQSGPVPHLSQERHAQVSQPSRAASIAFDLAIMQRIGYVRE